MDLSLYLQRQTWLHLMPAWSKFLLLIAFSISFYRTDNVWFLTSMLALTVILVFYLRVPANRRKIMFLIPLIVVFLFATFSAFVNDFNSGVLTFLRLSILVLFASCVTMTTKSEDFMTFIERLLLPLSFMPFIKPQTVSLSLSLTLRFIPEIFKLGMDIREAQAARGLKTNPLALIVPLIVLTLKRADEVSDAINARTLD